MKTKEIMDRVKMHCLECCGYSKDEVIKCSSPECSLYPLRLGTDTPQANAKGPRIEDNEK